MNIFERLTQASDIDPKNVDKALKDYSERISQAENRIRKNQGLANSYAKTTRLP